MASASARPAAAFPAPTWVVLACLLGACADLPAIGSNVCGNGVRDVHEDCDTFADPELGPDTKCAPATDSTRACRYVCSTTQVCPIGWGCGPDGICRYSLGEYDEASDSPLSISNERIELADFDGDSFPDLLTVSGANLELRFGGGDGRFLFPFQTSTDFPNGPLALGDLDEDHRTDLVVPIPEGLFAMRGSERGTLDPIAFSPFGIPILPDGVQALPLRADDGSPFDSVLLMIAGCMVFDLGQGVACQPPRVPMPPGMLTNMLSGRVPRGDLQGGPAEEFALAFSGANQVFLYRSKDVAPGPTFQPSLELFATIDLDDTVLYGARFADVDGDDDLDLMVSIGGSDGDQVAVAFNAGNGVFRDALGVAGHAKVDPFFVCLADPCQCPGNVCPERPPLGSQRWPLAAGPLNASDKVADYVSESGVYLRVGALQLLQTAVNIHTQPWSEAEIGDFNRDGKHDIAAVMSGQDGIDFYIGVGTGLFNPAHVDTVDPPFALRTGDFDGDLVDDLAVGEHGRTTDQFDDSLSVLFGRLQGAPEAPVSMGRLHFIEFMEPMRLITGLGNIDMISDLLVQSYAEPTDTGHEDRSLAFLIGSAQRRLLSPFVLTEPTLGTDRPLAVIIGRFAGDDSIPDMLALAPPRVWIAKGAGKAQFNPGDAKPINLSSVFEGASQFDPACASFTSSDLGLRDGIDEVIGVGQNGCNGEGEPGVPRLLIGSIVAGSINVSVEALPGGMLGPIQLKIADLDGDGFADLIIVFLGDFSSDPLHDAVAVYWGSATGYDLSAPSLVPKPEGADLRFSVTTLNADSDKQLELAVSGTNGIYIHNFDASTHVFDKPTAPVIDVPAFSILSADVDADGLDDLVFTDGSFVHVFTAKPNQVANQVVK